MSAVAHRQLVKSAADGNFNMLRIWGGAIFEPRAFYDAADGERSLHSRLHSRLHSPPELDYAGVAQFPTTAWLQVIILNIKQVHHLNTKSIILHTKSVILNTKSRHDSPLRDCLACGCRIWRTDVPRYAVRWGHRHQHTAGQD